jgi:acyl dehydratase
VTRAEERIYAEDLKRGMAVPLGSWRVTAEGIVAFAAEWDPQPFHLSEEAAASTPFGGIIASGVHTQAIFQRLAVARFFSRVAVIAGRGMRDMRLLKPVRPGTTLSGELIVQEIALRENGRALVTLRGTLIDQEDDVVYSMVGDLVVARRGHG